MPRRRPPLLARLRHRLATSVWVLALLVMGKLAGASMFHIDEVDLGSSVSSESPAQVVVVDAGQDDAAMAENDNADGARGSPRLTAEPVRSNDWPAAAGATVSAIAIRRPHPASPAI